MPIDKRICETCPIGGDHTPYEPKYSHDARFLVVVDPISKQGQALDRSLPPVQTKMFHKHAKLEGLQPDEFNYHPLCLCAYDKNEYTNREKTTIHKHCRQHFLDAIEDTEPEAILSLGAEATVHAMGRPTLITKVRGLGQKVADYVQPLMPLLHPAQAVRYPETENFFKSDMAGLGRLIDADYDIDKAGDIKVGEFVVVRDLQKLIDAKPELICFDTETTGLDWFRNTGMDARSYRTAHHKGKSFFKPKFQILCMSFTIADDNKAYVLPWNMPGCSIPEEDKPRLRNQIRKLLCRPETQVVGHNVKFDNVALWMTEGIRFQIGGDSMMLAAIHDENAMNKDLGSMTKIHVPEMAGYSDWFDAKYPKDRMWEVPWDDMVPYVGGDTIAGYKLYLELEKKVEQDEGNINHYERISVPGLNAFAAIETRGMYTEVEQALPEFREFLAADVARRRRSIMSQIPKSIQRAHVAKMKGDAAKALSLSRSDLLLDILFRHDDGFKLKPVVFTASTMNLPEHRRVPSVSSKDHLPYFFETCPFTFELAEYVKLNDLLNKSVINFETKYIHGGKVRPNYALHKTVTRRTSSSNPNGQNIPKRGEMALSYRKMFTAPPGYYVLEVDLSQAELRIAGDMANDPTIINIYRTGGDIHISTACIALGVTAERFAALPKSEQKEWRTKAKAINFGFIYGMGWRKFIGYAKTQYGVTFTEAQAKRIRAAYFKKYSGLSAWHERTRKYVKQHKFVRSYTGLTRKLPMIDSPDEGTQAEAGRQAINSPVQELGSSLGVMSLGRMNTELDPEYFEFVGFVHDAIVAYVKCEYLDWGLKTLKGYMESNPLQKWFGRTMRAPILAEAGFGLNLGEVYELPDFKLDQPYDFANSSHLKDKEGNLVINVPRQRVPPNNGRLKRSPYTLPTDLEDENVPTPTVAASRRRRLMAAPAVPVKRAAKAVLKTPTMIRRSRPVSRPTSH